MRATLFPKNDKMRLLQDRLGELEAECRRCVQGMQVESSYSHLPSAVAAPPNAVVDLDAYCAATLHTILNTLCQLNSEPLRLRGAPPQTDMPKALQVIVRQYVDSRHKAQCDKDPLVKAQMEHLCHAIMEYTISHILIPVKKELKRSHGLEHHLSLQLTLQQLEERLPDSLYPNYRQ